MGLLSRLPSQARWLINRPPLSRAAQDEAGEIVRHWTERFRDAKNPNGREMMMMVDDAGGTLDMGDPIGIYGRGSRSPNVGDADQVGPSHHQVAEATKQYQEGRPPLAVHHSHPTGGGGLEIDGKDWGHFVALSPPDNVFAAHPGFESMFAHMPEGGWSASRFTKEGRSGRIFRDYGTDIQLGLREATDAAHDILPILGQGKTGGEVFYQMHKTGLSDPAAMGLLGWSSEGNNRALHRMGMIDYDSQHHDPGSMDRFAEVIKAAEEAALKFYRVQWTGLGLKERGQILAMLGVGGAAADALMQDQKGATTRGLMSRSDV